MNVSQGDVILTKSGAVGQVAHVNLVNGIPFYRLQLVAFMPWGPVLTRQTELINAGEVARIKKAAAVTEVSAVA